MEPSFSKKKLEQRLYDELGIELTLTFYKESALFTISVSIL